MALQYKIAESASKSELEQEVTNLLNESWSLQGPLIIYFNPLTQTIMYAQPLQTGAIVTNWLA